MPPGPAAPACCSKEEEEILEGTLPPSPRIPTPIVYAFRFGCFRGCPRSRARLVRRPRTPPKPLHNQQQQQRSLSLPTFVLLPCPGLPWSANGKRRWPHCLPHCPHAEQTSEARSASQKGQTPSFSFRHACLAWPGPDESPARSSQQCTHCGLEV